jgi:hypothetical protein
MNCWVNSASAIAGSSRFLLSVADPDDGDALLGKPLNAYCAVHASPGMSPVIGYGAIASLIAEDRELGFQGIDEVVLYRGAGRLSRIERARMSIAPARHLLHQCVVPLVEGRELAAPTARFRVLGVSLAIFGKNSPEPVELAMLAEQMRAAQERRRQIPDSHGIPF